MITVFSDSTFLEHSVVNEVLNDHAKESLTGKYQQREDITSQNSAGEGSGLV